MSGGPSDTFPIGALLDRGRPNGSSEPTACRARVAPRGQNGFHIDAATFTGRRHRKMILTSGAACATLNWPNDAHRVRAVRNHATTRNLTCQHDTAARLRRRRRAAGGHADWARIRAMDRVAADEAFFAGHEARSRCAYTRPTVCLCGGSETLASGVKHICSWRVQGNLAPRINSSRAGLEDARAGDTLGISCMVEAARRRSLRHPLGQPTTTWTPSDTETRSASSNIRLAVQRDTR